MAVTAAKLDKLAENLQQFWPADATTLVPGEFNGERPFFGPNFRPADLPFSNGERHPFFRR